MGGLFGSVKYYSYLCVDALDIGICETPLSITAIKLIYDFIGEIPENVCFLTFFAVSLC